MPNPTTRREHLNWCKQRALEVCDRGNAVEAFNSMSSDLWRHDATRDHPAIILGKMMMMGGCLQAPFEMRRFIEGFN
jgi:hypothetical protein